MLNLSRKVCADAEEIRKKKVMKWLGIPPNQDTGAPALQDILAVQDLITQGNKAICQAAVHRQTRIPKIADRAPPDLLDLKVQGHPEVLAPLTTRKEVHVAANSKMVANLLITPIDLLLH